MIKVSETVNGKFDIVLSDGYKTQLHNRGKAPAKIDIHGEASTVSMTAKLGSNKQMKFGEKKHDYNKPLNVSKAKKSSRLAAQFDHRLSKKDKEMPRKIKQVATVKKSSKAGDDSCDEANGNAAFVTKSELASLLAALNNTNSGDVSTSLSKTMLTQLADQNKNATPAPEKTTDNSQLDSHEKQRDLNQSDQKAESQLLQSVTEPPDIAKEHINPTCTSNVEMTKPMAMRSSFAVGAPGLVTNDLQNDKAARHKQWIKDLELQIQQKKEKEQLIKEPPSEGLFSQRETERVGIDARRTKKYSPSWTVKTIGETSEQQKQTENSVARHGRGRGLMNIMLSMDDVDRQRKKTLEHQKAIEVQVEYRRRQKLEEREQRLKEEALEEERLAREREKLQKQFEEEKQKTKEKEEQARLRAHQLQESISKAYESAQQLKREKRKKHIRGSILNNSFKESRGNDKSQPEERNVEASSPNIPQNKSISIIQDCNTNRVPPPNLQSFSVSDSQFKLNQNISSRLSGSTSKPVVVSARNMKTSRSEPELLGRSRDLMLKWVDEDVGSCSLIDDKNHVYDKSLGQASSFEFMVPFHRTASATFNVTDSLQENGEEDAVIVTQQRNDHSKHRKHLKKGRSIPEAQPTRASLLREKVTNQQPTSNQRYRETIEAPGKTVQIQKSKQNVVNKESTFKCKRSQTEETKEKDNSTQVLSQFTPTPHQEEILEQLSALRKGLLMKDQELKTRIFQISNHGIST